jgi:hypothetical protein
MSTVPIRTACWLALPRGVCRNTCHRVAVCRALALQVLAPTPQQPGQQQAATAAGQQQPLQQQGARLRPQLTPSPSMALRQDPVAAALAHVQVGHGRQVAAAV